MLGNLLNTTVVTSTETFTSQVTTTWARIRLVGDGGAGGGVNGTSGDSGCAGGGGAGAYLEAVCPMPGNTGYSVVIGTGGTGVAAGTGNSGSGSTITIQGVTYTAGGGAGGPGVTATTTGITAAGGLGGTASNGQLNVQGQPGQPGFVTASSTGLGTAGSGGSGPWGGGGRTRCDSTGAGNAAGAYGGGGGGAYSSAASGADNAGGAGFAGVLIVEEYSDLLLPMPQADPEVVKSPTRKQPSPDDWLSVPQVQRPSWLQDDVARRPFPADYKRVPYQDDSIGVPQIQRPGWFFDEPQRSAIAKATHKPAVDEWQLKPLPFPGLPPSEEPSPRRSKPFSQQDDFYLAPHTTVSTTKAIPWSDPETVRAPSRRQPVDDQPIGSPALTKPSWLQDDSIQLGKRPKVQADDWLSVPALTKPSWLQDDVGPRPFVLAYKRIASADDSISVPQIQRPGWLQDDSSPHGLRGKVQADDQIGLPAIQRPSWVVDDSVPKWRPKPFSADDWLSVPQIQKPSWLQDDSYPKPFPLAYKRVDRSDDAISHPALTRPSFFPDDSVPKWHPRPFTQDDWLSVPSLTKPSWLQDDMAARPFVSGIKRVQVDEWRLVPFVSSFTASHQPWPDPEVVRSPRRKEPIEDQPIGSPALTRPSWLADDSVPHGVRGKLAPDDQIGLPALKKPSWLQDDSPRKIRAPARPAEEATIGRAPSSAHLFEDVRQTRKKPSIPADEQVSSHTHAPIPFADEPGRLRRRTPTTEDAQPLGRVPTPPLALAIEEALRRARTRPPPPDDFPLNARGLPDLGWIPSDAVHRWPTHPRFDDWVPAPRSLPPAPSLRPLPNTFATVQSTPVNVVSVQSNTRVASTVQDGSLPNSGTVQPLTIVEATVQDTGPLTAEVLPTT
jgi:hypothetical protein